MENQTRYDLNAAVENWRNELAAESSLTPDTRRELETHLRDSIAELRQRGLNEEESFWLARRRIGPPQQVAKEFEKADPAGIWRQRMFWMCLGLFLYSALVSALASIIQMLTPIDTSWRLIAIADLLQASWPILAPAIVITLAMLLASGKMNRSVQRTKSLTETRLHVAIFALTIIAIQCGLAILADKIFEARFTHLTLLQLYSLRGVPQRPFLGQMFQVCYPSLIWALILIWLTPAQKQKTLKRA